VGVSPGGTDARTVTPSLVLLCSPCALITFRDAV
jgi:hypothetical protein